METRIILTLACVATIFILHASAEEGMRQCGDPFRPVQLDNIRIRDCARDEACKVDYKRPEITVYFEYTAPKDYPPAEEYYVNVPACQVLITSPSESVQEDCGVTLFTENWTTSVWNPVFGEVKKGDKFYIACYCGTWKEFKLGESGTFNTTVWIEGNVVSRYFPKRKDMVPYGDCVKGDLTFVDSTELESDEESEEEK